ncbi:MAG: DUF5681 domain-containing protein [Planctomycetes bacterium]|nr:DUF5681 domain-containing protein [Planctomycetota bacterium]
MAASSTSWRKGQSGNPAGKPRGVASKLRVLRELTTDDVLARVWNALLEKAAEGDVSACRVVLDRVLGPTATLDDVDGDDTADLFQSLIAKVKANGR